MKTRFTSLLVLALCAVSSLSAQPRQKQSETKAEKPRLTEEERIQRQANRMSAELMLDDKTSAKFTDVYQQYLKEMNDCRKENRKAMKESCPQGRTKCTQGEKPALTDAEIEARIEKRFAQQRQMLDIHEKYYKELKRHYKIFCVNGNTGFRNESRIFYFIHLQKEEYYERKESSSA